MDSVKRSGKLGADTPFVGHQIYIVEETVMLIALSPPVMHFTIRNLALSTSVICTNDEYPLTSRTFVERLSAELRTYFNVFER